MYHVVCIDMCYALIFYVGFMARELCRLVWEVGEMMILPLELWHRKIKDQAQTHLSKRPTKKILNGGKHHKYIVLSNLVSYVFKCHFLGFSYNDLQTWKCSRVGLDKYIQCDQEYGIDLPT